MSEEDERKPSFDGRYPPSRISLMSADDDDDYEETTRRIGGVAAFTNIPGPPAFKSAQMNMMGPTITTSNSKPQPLFDSISRKVPNTGAWMLKEVPTLPEFHPLERTAVFVPHSKASDVSARISDVLRDRSIEAEYDNDKAKVKCVTADGVDFRVRLYRGRGDFSHGVIVEVQRRFGASVNFHKDTQAILDAAEGKVPSPPPPSFGGSSLPMVSDAEDSDYEVDGSSSLNLVAMMLNHPGYDSHYLAYQTLIPLTSPSKIGLSTARAVSSELLRPGNAVGSKVMALVMARKEEDDMFKLRTMALTVLANVIQSCKGKIGMPLREQLRPLLIEELFNAEKNPRNAQMAAHCVEYLLQDDHDAAEFNDALEKALEVGIARHAGLRMQAQRCLDKVRGM